MEPVLTPEEMAEADRRTIAAGTRVEVLMERAGRAVAWAVRRVCGGTYGRRVVVVCGKGNNGGDGLVAARVLRGWGVHVDVFELKDGIDRDRCRRALQRTDCVVDAMYGTGFNGRLEGDAHWFACESWGAPVVAVDIPSGIDGLTGQFDGDGHAVEADLTVTFAALKPGLLFEPGVEFAGEIEVADIGIDVGAASTGVTDADDVLVALPRRDAGAHKWQSGVMVVGGSNGMTGAPLMVSRAAMRAGAGIVWCCIPGEGAAARAAGSEVITKDLAEVPDALHDVERFRALVVGPGLGRDDHIAAGVRELGAKAPIPLVLDADGLNALSGDPSPLEARGEPTIVTPHEGEYERVAGEPVGTDRLAAARRLADRSGAVVLLKGPATVVAEPGGRTAINPTGGPWLATAGTGDVLSGIVGGLLAGGAHAFEAAAAGAWLHGRAADVAGHTGLVAGDLIEALPATLRSLEED
ncbi:MAG TPA: NAD(P)H-hydrate dehydratase [Acidimicrobiia bacterium]|nr:NAD(P)H-hydrate dehydratase [Acidimicrobiia bacterium]